VAAAAPVTNGRIRVFIVLPVPPPGIGGNGAGTFRQAPTPRVGAVDFRSGSYRVRNVPLRSGTRQVIARAPGNRPSLERVRPAIVMGAERGTSGTDGWCGTDPEVRRRIRTAPDPDILGSSMVDSPRSLVGSE